MRAYRDNSGAWYIQYRYTTLEGDVKKTCKRGFRTKREAEKWYRDFTEKKNRSCDMPFSSFVEVYIEDMSARLREYGCSHAPFGPQRTGPAAPNQR